MDLAAHSLEGGRKNAFYSVHIIEIAVDSLDNATEGGYGVSGGVVCGGRALDETYVGTGFGEGDSAGGSNA